MTTALKNMEVFQPEVKLQGNQFKSRPPKGGRKMIMTRRKRSGDKEKSKCKAWMIL